MVNRYKKCCDGQGKVTMTPEADLCPQPLKWLLRYSTESHRIRKASIKTKQTQTTKSYLLNSTQHQFSKDLFQTSVLVHRNNPPPPRHALVCLLSPPLRFSDCSHSAMFCLFSSNRALWEAQPPWEYKAHLQSMVQMMATDTLRMEGTVDGDPYYSKTDRKKYSSFSQCHSRVLFCFLFTVLPLPAPTRPELRNTEWLDFSTGICFLIYILNFWLIFELLNKIWVLLFIFIQTIDTKQQFIKRVTREVKIMQFY